MGRFTSLLVLLHSVFAVCALDLTLSTVTPSGAPAISRSLISLSIEQDRWTDWSGTTSRNEFFFNTLDNIKQITGEPPQIRIGADSEDRTNFRADIPFSEVIFPAPSDRTPYPEASSVTVGNGYYLTARFLPSGTHVVWGVNLASNNLTASYLQARSIADAFSSQAVKSAGVTLDFIEIGNEPDLYYLHNYKPTSYSIADYTQEWISIASNVSAAAGISASSHVKFFGPSFATSFTFGAGTFTTQNFLTRGVMDSAPGKLLKTFAQHHYNGPSTSLPTQGTLQDLTTKAYIRGNITHFAPDIKLARDRGLDFVFGETNSLPNHGIPNVSNTAGAALWALDYSLFAAQSGITRLYFHEGIGYKYNLIQPVTLTRSPLDGSALSSPLPPHIQPTYYAAIIAAEAIGSSGATQAVEIAINDPTISGYAFYEKDKLARAVFINHKCFFTGSSAPRGSVHITLGFAGPNSGRPSHARVKRLSMGHTDDVSGVTWGGQTYETPDARVAGTLSVSKGKIEDGFDISDSEAVLLFFN